MTERSEALVRIPVIIISGIVLAIWKSLVHLIAILHWFVVIFTNKRSKELADFCEIWNTQLYIFVKYLTFVSNKRPFPFGHLVKNTSKFGK